MIYFTENSKLTAMSAKANPNMNLMSFISRLNRENKINSILDWGSGNGRHSVFLRNKNIKTYSYDPYIGSSNVDPYNAVSNIKPATEFDLVFTSYVLNVITPKEGEDVLRETERLSNNIIVHIVREDLRYLKGKHKITAKGTYQRDVRKEELLNSGYFRKNGMFIKIKEPKFIL